MRVNFDAQRGRGAGIGPGDGVVPGDGSGRMVKRPQNRVPGLVTEIQFRTQSRDLVGVDQLGVDTEVFVDFRTPAGGSQRGIRMRQRQVAALRVKDVEVEFVAEVLKQAHRLVVKPDASGVR